MPTVVGLILTNTNLNNDLENLEEKDRDNILTFICIYSIA